MNSFPKDIQIPQLETESQSFNIPSLWLDIIRGVRSCTKGGEVRGKKAKIINVDPMSTSFRLAAGISVIYESGSSLAQQAAWTALMVIK